MMKKLFTFKPQLLIKSNKKFFSTESSTFENFSKLLKSEERNLEREIKDSWVKNGKHLRFSRFYKLLAGMVLGTIVLGGWTRISNSGLSMVRWDLAKLSPPLNEEEWNKEFEEYKKFPQFLRDFPEMDMAKFKQIYLMEYYHRMLGKTIGFVFAGFILLNRKHLTSKLMKATSLIFLLGAFQGLVGWWMVKSGLTINETNEKGEVKVSPYRLAFHFTNAIFIFGLLLKLSLILGSKPASLNSNWIHLGSNASIRSKLMMTFHLFLVTMVYGCFMSGNRAGQITNTFPKMGDVWVPGKDHLDQNSGWRNLFENQYIVHFIHRTLGVATLGVAYLQLFSILSGRNAYLNPVALRWYFICFGMLNLQAYLGYKSVKLSVPKRVALEHQFTGVLTFTCFILALHRVRRVRDKEMKLVFNRLMEKDKTNFEKYLFNYKYFHPRNYEKYFRHHHNSL